MATLDYKTLNINVGKLRVVKDAAFELAESKLDSAKSGLLNDFNSHPVTREINAGPFSSNVSGTLGGYGNLFSFIGFESGSNPVEAVINLINKIRLVKSSYVRSISNGLLISFRLNAPQISKFENETPMPWASGRSWLTSIEKGISNFNSFLYKKLSGRSGGGTQSDKKIRSSSFSPVPYFTKMYSDFFKKINRTR
jgi:hypothetical protein